MTKAIAAKISRILALLTPRHPLDLHEEEQF